MAGEARGREQHRPGSSSSYPRQPSTSQSCLRAVASVAAAAAVATAMQFPPPPVTQPPQLAQGLGRKSYRPCKCSCLR